MITRSSNFHVKVKQYAARGPSPKGFASSVFTNLRSTCVYVWPSMHLRGLGWSAMTCVDFVGKLMWVFHRLATQCKSTQIDRKWIVYPWNDYFLWLAWTCEPTQLRIRLATHRKALRRLASSFGQVLSRVSIVDLRHRGTGFSTSSLVRLR